jgi:hypothetical protein
MPGIESLRRASRTGATALLALGALAAPAGCGPGNAPADGSTTDAAEGGADVVAMSRCMATTVPCQDQSAAQLGFFSTANSAMITAVSSDNGVFVNGIDATAGGMTPTRSFVYARFTATGLEQVNISDEESFTSMDWDIAFRRFIIRLNSGVSGPSCVDGARTAPNTDFAALTTAPANLTFHTEQYFTPTCDLVPDGSGLGSPSTVLASFWTYQGCIHMSGNVYVIRLRDGRQVKFQVLAYYEPAAQMQCDATNTLPSPSGAANLRVQWAPLGG